MFEPLEIANRSKNVVAAGANGDPRYRASQSYSARFHSFPTPGTIALIASLGTKVFA
jgi:hypothetical protein